MNDHSNHPSNIDPSLPISHVHVIDDNDYCSAEWYVHGPHDNCPGWPADNDYHDIDIPV